MNAKEIATLGVWGVAWAALVWCSVLPGHGHGFALSGRVAQGDVASMVSALHNYAADHDGCFPTELVSLLAMVPDADVYLIGYTDPPKDPWKRFYTYEAADDLHSFRVGTFGSDGTPGGWGDAKDIFVDPVAEGR